MNFNMKYYFVSLLLLALLLPISVLAAENLKSRGNLIPLPTGNCGPIEGANSKPENECCLNEKGCKDGTIGKNFCMDGLSECEYTLVDFVSLFIKLSQYILSIVGAAALLFFVYGGFTWIFSGGSAEDIKEGKSMITGAVIGLFIVFGAWILVNFIMAALTCPPEKAGKCFTEVRLFEQKWWEVKKE